MSVVSRYCYLSVPKHTHGLLYLWFEERQQDLHCWFNQDEAVSLCWAYNWNIILRKSLTQCRTCTTVLTIYQSGNGFVLLGTSYYMQQCWQSSTTLYGINEFNHRSPWMLQYDSGTSTVHTAVLLWDIDFKEDQYLKNAVGKGRCLFV